METKRIKITIEGGNIGFEFVSGDGHILNYEQMSRDEQQRIVKTLADGYVFFNTHLKSK